MPKMVMYVRNLNVELPDIRKDIRHFVSNRYIPGTVYICIPSFFELTFLFFFFFSKDLAK